MKPSLRLVRIFLPVFALLWPGKSMGLPVPSSAEIVSVRPGAYLTLDQARKDAAPGQAVSKGSLIETDPYGRLSLLLPDHALLKIGSDTRFVYEGPGEDRRTWFLDKGKVWLRGLFRKRAFSVRTPTAVVGVRGTEWYMTVAPDGTTAVGVVDGRVEVENPLGSLSLDSREMALVQPGRAPVKSAYLTPENAVNWTLKYRGFWDRPDFERAPEALRSVLEEALAAFHANDLAGAFAVLDRIRPAHGYSASWLAMAGFLALVSGNDGEARRLLGEAEAVDPGWALPRAHLALMDLVENKPGQARQRAVKALEIQPDSAVARIALAYVSKAELKLEEAYREARRAVAGSPGFDAAILVAAAIALEMEDAKGCRTLLGKLSENASVAAERETLFGFLALRDDDSRTAETHFTQAVALDPEQPDGWLGLGIARFRRKRISDGLDAMARAALIAPQVSAYQSYLAKAFFEADLVDEAKASLARAKRLDPKDPTPYLYESLWNNQIHRPGQAIRNLDAARKLNDNRAVFRSRYLLDQDRSILMSNVSQIYSRLGFDHTSIQRAARAATVDPENESAHRRLYFALLFDPNFYQQAAATELLLAKLLVPPTRNGVVFDEDSLSPYQEMFERAGVDAALSGAYFESADQDTRTRNPAGTVSLAAQLETPVAFHTLIHLGRNRVDSEIETDQVFSGMESHTFQGSDQDTDLGSVQTFAKWQVTPAIGVFADGMLRKADTDLSGEVRSSMASSGFPVGTTRTRSAGSSDLQVGDVDAGINAQLFDRTRCLFHFSHNNTRGEGDTRQDILSDYYSSNQILTFDQDAIEQIVQGAFWQTLSDHFFQLGFRHYAKDASTLSITEGSGPYSFLTRSDQAEDFEFTSGFFFHQYRLGEALDLIWGLSLDRSQYESPSRRKADRTTTNPMAGITWAFHPDWRLRAAYLQNMVGDRSERLQPSMIAGFPLLRVSQLDAFTEEQLLQLRHKTVAVGLDYEFPGHPLFCGMEVGYDQADSRFFESSTADTLRRIDNNAHHFRFYLETLITDDLSTALAYRFTDYDYPASQSENRVDWKTAYFTRSGLILNLNAVYRSRRPDDDLAGLSTQETWAFEPSFDWYLMNNKLHLALTGHLEENITESDTVDRNTFRWIRASATLHF